LPPAGTLGRDTGAESPTLRTAARTAAGVNIEISNQEFTSPLDELSESLPDWFERPGSRSSRRAFGLWVIWIIIMTIVVLGVVFQNLNNH
jgi:hypothetical protein